MAPYKDGNGLRIKERGVEQYLCNNCSLSEYSALIDENGVLVRLECLSCDTRYAITDDKKLVELGEGEE